MSQIQSKAPCSLLPCSLFDLKFMEIDSKRIKSQLSKVQKMVPKIIASPGTICSKPRVSCFNLLLGDDLAAMIRNAELYMLKQSHFYSHIVGSS